MEVGAAKQTRRPRMFQAQGRADPAGLAQRMFDCPNPKKAEAMETVQSLSSYQNSDDEGTSEGRLLAKALESR